FKQVVRLRPRDFPNQLHRSAPNTSRRLSLTNTKHDQVAGNLISWQNFSRSMLPPETIATIGPLPTFPVNAAASGSAPAPSEIILAFSAISRIAFCVSFRLTTIQPFTTGFIRSHLRGPPV